MRLSDEIRTALRAVWEIHACTLNYIELLEAALTAKERQSVFSRLDKFLDQEESAIRELRRILRNESAKDAERYIWPRSLGGTP